MNDEKFVTKKKIAKNIFIFFFYFFYQVIPVLVLNMLNIDTSKWNNLQRNIYLISTAAIYMLFVLFIYRKELKDDLKKLKGNYIDNLSKYIPIYVFGVLLMSISNVIISNFTNMEISGNEETVRNYIKLFPIYMSFSTVIYAPIVEEITFRKTIRNIVDNKWIFIILSGLIFGLVHLSSPYGLNDYLMTIPYILMGTVLSYIFYKSDNIFISISLHALHNFILLLIQFIGG